jgi:hypothetical protein
VTRKISILYEAGNPFDLQAPNPNYIGNLLASALGMPLGLFAPGYKTPRSVQMNIGIQHEIRQGMVFSADYLRNIETRTLLGLDINHVGDVNNFNLGAAQAAIAAETSFGCATVNCVTAAGATISDYASNGLTYDVQVGLQPARFPRRIRRIQGRLCAFPGRNANQSQAFLLEPLKPGAYQFSLLI